MDTQMAIEGHVISADGTRIGYIQRGSGPGIVLIQGAMGTAYNFEDLAIALSHRFTIYTPDRRGRGLSPKTYDSGHSIARDVEDIDALLAETQCSFVFGLSSGAIITLEAARTLQRVKRAAVFEPPFYPHGISYDGIRQLNNEIENRFWASALVTALATAETAPWMIQVLPKFVARVLAYLVLQMDDRSNSPYAKLRDMLPGIRYDFNVVGGMDGKVQSLVAVEKPILLLSGTCSAAFLRESVRTLKGILPQAEHIEFNDVDHSGPWNSSRGGSPQLVGAALETFFA